MCARRLSITLFSYVISLVRLSFEKFGQNLFFTPVLTPGNQWVDCIKNPHRQKLCNFWISTTFVSDVFLKNHFPLRYWANYLITKLCPCIKIMYKSLTRLPSTDTIFHVLQTSTARKLTTQDFTSHWLIHYRAPVFVTHNLPPPSPESVSWYSSRFYCQYCSKAEERMTNPLKQ